MRKAYLPAALGLAGVIIAVASPALADVKAGVDAWSRGEYRKAVDEWRPAAIAGDADAQFNLAQAYKLGRGVPVDMAMAESWYRKAALQGQVEAEANYGLILFQNGKRTDALPWLEKSVARGEPRAQLVLGTMLYNGDGVARDWPRAYALLVRSAAQGQPRASEVQAQMDQYIPAADRQKGLALARQYEAEAQRPVLPPEITGQGSQVAMRGTDLPPSSYDQHRGAQPNVDAPQPFAPPPPVVAHVPTRRPPPQQQAVATTAPQPGRSGPPVAGRGWRIQFGAFRDEGNATALWGKLKGQVSALASLQPFLVRTGTLTKLQAGPLASSADAARVCNAVRPTRTPCVPVAP
ncbi:MAG: SPOR domain-containing protein [Candidatus Sphingomonas phytovorans]|nr:SPOR domain-containing protein [Sphingomonas sp.]WEK01672.1 MAG: SPOR domain-containing protein [Sphingomonas sp.]